MRTSAHYIIALILFYSLSLSGQVKIGFNPETIDPGSILELESDSKVLVISRLTDSAMNTLTPLRGALVYNTDAGCIYYYDGSRWINLCEDTGAVNISLETNEDSLVLLDSNDNTVSVPLDSINTNTFTSNPIVNPAERDSTIVITQTGNNYNFEVGMISGENIIDTSINGQLDIQNGSITGNKIQNDAINASLINENVAGTGLTQDATGALQVDVSLIAGDGALSSPNATIAITGEPSLALFDDVGIDIATGSANQVLKTNAAGTNVEWAILDATSLAGQNLTATDGSITVTNGTGATLVASSIQVADDGITSAKIRDGQVQTDDISAGGINQFLRTNATGIVEWSTITGLVAASDVTFNDALSSLGTTNAQDAIDLLAASNAADADTDATNENVTGVAFTDDDADGTGSTELITITNADGSTQTGTITFPADADTSATNENVTGVAFTDDDADGTGSTELITITNADGSTQTGTITFPADADTSATNENVTGVAFTDDDADGTGSTELITITNADGSTQTGTITFPADADTSATNENVTGVAFTDNDADGTGSTELITITNADGSTQTGTITFPADADTSATNENVTGVAFTDNDADGTGSTELITITNADGSTQTGTITFPADADTSATNENVTGVAFTDNDADGTGSTELITITNADGSTQTGTITFPADADTSATNENVTGVAFTDNDADGTGSTELITITNADGSTQTGTITFPADADTSATNENVTGVAFTDNDADGTGSTELITITNADGSTQTGTITFPADANTNLATNNLAQPVNTDRTYDLNNGDLRFTGTGNIRIGSSTTAIPNKLHVEGEIRVEGVNSAEGTEGAPAYSFSTGDDSDTGMYRPEADAIGFSVGGNEALRIDEPTIGVTNVIVNGAFSTNIRTEPGAGTVDIEDNDYTVIIENATTVNLPAPSTSGTSYNLGKIYIIKNITGGNITISSFIDNLGINSTSLTTGVTHLQSDGTNWHQIN